MEDLNKFIEEELREGNDRLWVMSFLKQLGIVGKKIYNVAYESEARKKLGKNLIKLKDKLEKL